MYKLEDLIKKQAFVRVAILVLIAVILFVIRDMINVLLMTFIIVYFVSRGQALISNTFDKNNKVSSKIIIIGIFLVTILVVGLGISGFLPTVIEQFKNIISDITNIYENKETARMFDSIKEILDKVYAMITSKEGITYITNYITDIGKLGIQLFLSLILSLFFLLESEKVKKFTVRFKKSKVNWFYNEISYLGKKFLDSFGKVIEVQVIIAFTNGIISLIALAIIGFPNVIGFGIMIMLLGLIPVAGVMISLIPLCIVGYNFGGIAYVIYILVMIAVIHAFESYILNPKLMSSKTKIPVFYTFIVLLIAEHFFGVWGLLFGVPLFVFILDVLEVPMAN